MTYRIATKNDALAIAELHCESWRVTYRGILSDSYLEGDILPDRQQVWVNRLSNVASTQYVLLATEGDQLCGFVCAYGNDDDRWGALIDNLHVYPKYKGRGIGSALMRKAASWIQQHYPHSGFYLWVYADNKQAIDFYVRMGGTKIGSRMDNNPGGGSSNAIRYVWRERDLVTLLQGQPRRALMSV